MIKTIVISVAVFLCLSAFHGFRSATPKLPGEYIYIPGGTSSDGDADTSERFALPGYYMSKYEITNQQYREFFNEVSQSLSEGEIAKIRVDSNGWNEVLSYQEPMVSIYFKHPAYNNYPVVNINHEGALKYCEGLQLKIQKDNPNLFIAVKLPSRLQWTYAAMGGRFHSIYPWFGNYLRDKKGKFLCNFNSINESAIVRNKETGAPEIIYWAPPFKTADVRTYLPNNFDLYNMSGNAAEMIDSIGVCMGGSWLDFGGDVKVTSKAAYDKPSPRVGFRPIIIVKEVSQN